MWKETIAFKRTVVEAYVPVVSRDWKQDAVAVYVQVSEDDLSRPTEQVEEKSFTGMTAIGGLPGPVRSWRAIEIGGTEAREPATPLIGREDDLDLLRLVYRRPVRERPHMAFAVEDLDEAEQVTESEFVKLAARAGIRRRLSFRSTVELSEQHSSALHELWPR